MKTMTLKPELCVDVDAWDAMKIWPTNTLILYGM